MLTKQTITKKMDVPAEQAWDAILGIGRLDAWFPSVATCVVDTIDPSADGPGQNLRHKGAGLGLGFEIDRPDDNGQRVEGCGHLHGPV